MADDGPEHDVPTEPAAPDVPVEPVRRASEWSFEWWGPLPVLAIVVAAIVGWRLTGSAGSGSDDGVAADAVVTTTEPIRATTTTVAATTTTPTTAPTTTTTEPGEPTVHIVGVMEPCRFGERCLVASFTIEGFDEPSGRFTCIYPNSTRDFSFEGDGKDDACLTADAGDTIIIEVDGVRSAAISEDDLDG